MKTVAILGCGPSGLLAAHACVRAGLDPIIFSRKVKSPIFAAMFLHKYIPDICPDDPELDIVVVKTGTREGYAENVYGNPDAPVSWDKFVEGKLPAFSLGKAYDKLWDMYHERVMDKDLSALEISVLAAKYDLTFSTIPRPVLCRQNHSFLAQEIWVQHGPTQSPHDAEIMYYNGRAYKSPFGPKWYRYSRINGYRAWEFRGDRQPTDIPGMSVSRGRKPLSTNCDCRKDVIKLGRFGKWEKQVLTHHVYEEVTDVLHEVR